MGRTKAVAVVLGYNVASVLAKTVRAIPPGSVDEIIVVDDGSNDGTGEVARQLGVRIISHGRNRGYGASQKTGYRNAIRLGAEVVVMVHGDNQYDPALVPEFVRKIRDEGYDMATGTRMVLGDALANGMPSWKYVSNRCLTWLENLAFQTRLSDYHNGYRAFSTKFLQAIPLERLSDKFDFDTDIIIQAAIHRARIAEVPHPTRYEDENSQMSFLKGVRYGSSILATVLCYLFHRVGLWRRDIFNPR